MTLDAIGTFIRVLALVVALGLATCSFVHTFGIPNGLSRRSSPTSLHVSLWETDLIFHLEGEDDGKSESDEQTNDLVQHKKAKQIEIIKYKRQVPNDKLWCPFYFSLFQNQRYIHDPTTKALHMDDELKRMESKYHQLGGDELSPLHYPLGSGLDNYNGKMVKPNKRVYELVTRAYSKANLGQEGAELAEQAVTRYEKYNTSKQATTIMMAFIMKAYIAAGNLERTEYWLHRIEKRYEITQHVTDRPGFYIYNPFVIGLKQMTDVSDKKAAKLSMEILEKMNILAKSNAKHNLSPGREIYLEIMKYQELGYKGSAAFYRIEKVFLQLQKNYSSAGKHHRLKPSIEALAPVFVAASKCYFPDDDAVVKRVNALFDEFGQLYKETGDPDFCPDATICNSLNSIYARINRHKMNLTEFTERTMILLQSMEEHSVEFNEPRDKTSAFNRVLHAAESQMPDDPMRDPLKTKEVFVMALNIFKKFHDDGALVTASPNKATYQIFLRACAKLPEGETRSKLAAKAFQFCQQKGLVTVDTVYKLYKANPEYALSVLRSTDLGFEKGTFAFAVSEN